MSKILGEKLSKEQQNLFNEQEICGIVTTVGADGYPNTAPMAVFYAPDLDTVRMSVGNMHDTYQNIKETSDKVMLNVLAGEDHAFSVKGKAKIVRESSDTNNAMSIIDLEVEQIKEDVSPVAKVVNGVELEHRKDKAKQFLESLRQELEQV